MGVNRSYMLIDVFQQKFSTFYGMKANRSSRVYYWMVKEPPSIPIDQL